SPDRTPAVTIKVFQGERPMAHDNKALGNFDLVGIPPAPRGVPQIEVTFDIDANGILNVSAKDLGTEKQQAMTITAPNKLNEADVEKMKKEAESHAEDDKKRKEEAEIVNTADTLIYSSETTLKELGDKVDPAKIEPIKKGVEELKKLMEPEEKDRPAIKAKVEEVEKLMQEAATEMYQKAQQEHAQQEQAKKDAKPEDKSGEKVVDAEFEEEKKSEDKPEAKAEPEKPEPPKAEEKPKEKKKDDLF
ncbi:Hsp70 family protein, partial [Nanoarchaeota archaeon]